MPDAPPATAPGWSAHVVDVGTGEVLLSEDADAVRRTASVAKVLLLTALAEAVEAGDVEPDEPLDRSVTPRVADSGLWHRMTTTTLPVDDVALLVGTVSDNWATNVLVARLGLARVQAVATSSGLDDTQLWDLVRDARGPGDVATLSTGTARAWAGVMARLHAGTWSGAAVSARVLGWLAGGVDHSMVAGGLARDPLVADARLVSKTGTDDGVRADVGLVRGTQRNLAYAVLWNGPEAEAPDVLDRMRALGARLRAVVEDAGTEGAGGGTPARAGVTPQDPDAPRGPGTSKSA
ncbi:hypothetical protein GCM10023340_05490 [Nocardioides marinquilinus]|uniref:Beta-lactamase class A catalytic domain-containing protein n=1 Tax=Nocardioides marinquilinus TaxID=1210400 RepID=A0ABP9P886_9ACTN